MSFENWTIDELFARCTDYDDGSLSMDKDEFAALRRMLQGAAQPQNAQQNIQENIPFEQWLSQQTGTIDVECGCVMTEVFFHWLRVAYEAGNSPVIPDGWVPCSERMPSVGEKVLAYRPDAPESNDPLIKMAKYVGKSAHGHGFDCYCKPSHWMLLPSAPQQEA